MVTIRDIAEKLNLSTATVSRALNNDTRISEQTRGLVQDVAAQMNYAGKPRKKDRSTNSVIGIISPEIISYNYASVVESITDNLRKHGYTSMVSVTNFCARTVRTLLDMYESMHAAGIVVIMYNDSAYIEILANFKRKSATPIVQISNFDEYEAYDSLMINNRVAARILVDHLYQLGHRNIGIVTEPAAADRVRAISERMGELDILSKKTRQIVVPDARFEEAGYIGAMKILKNGDRLSAIIAPYDYMAIGVLKACIDLGISVPEELSVAGIDNVNTSKYAYKALTTVSMPQTDMGRIAVRILIDRIKKTNGDTPAIQHVSLDPALIVRETTAPVAPLFVR